MSATKEHYGLLSEQLGFNGDLDEPVCNAIRAFEMLRRIEQAVLDKTATMPVDLYDEMTDAMSESGYHPVKALAKTRANRGLPPIVPGAPYIGLTATEGGLS